MLPSPLSIGRGKGQRQKMKGIKDIGNRVSGKSQMKTAGEHDENGRGKRQEKK